MNEGILHVIEQLGLAHKHALAVIEQQQHEIDDLRTRLDATP